MFFCDTLRDKCANALHNTRKAMAAASQFFYYAMLGPKDQAWSLGAWSVGFLSIFLQDNDLANVDASPLSKCLSWMGSCWNQMMLVPPSKAQTQQTVIYEYRLGYLRRRKNSGRNASHTQTTSILVQFTARAVGKLDPKTAWKRAKTWKNKTNKNMKKRCKNMENTQKTWQKTWKTWKKHEKNHAKTWKTWNKHEKTWKKQCSSKHYNPAKTLITIKMQGK